MVNDYEGKPTNVDIQAVTPSDIVKAYSGKANKCCCGCSGNFYYSSANRAEGEDDRGYPLAEDDVSDRDLVRVLRQIQANEDKAVVSLDGIGAHAAVELGRRLYVVYFNRDFKRKLGAA